MSNINLYRVILPTADIEVTARFYGALLGDKGERVSPGRHYFRCGGTILACYSPSADGDAAETWQFHSNQFLYFSVAGLEAMFESFRCLVDDGLGSLDSGRIQEMPWGERLFYGNDPFGAPICFVDEKTLFTGS